MSDPDDKERLRRLDDRIARAKGVQAPQPKGQEHYSMASLAWRMVTELVAGIAIGLGIGYGLDVLLGTMPIFLVLFILLGLAAGVKTMLRTAEEVQKGQEAGAPADKGD